MASSVGRPLDLGVIGNCAVSALVDAQGRLLWMCLPRPDSDPVFSGLLQRELGASGDGVFAVDLAGFDRAEQKYFRNTAILETTLGSRDGGTVRITDFCPRFVRRGRMFSPMSFVRLIEPVAGRPLVTLRLRPAGSHGVSGAVACVGSHHLRYQAQDVTYRVTTDASLTAITERRAIVLDRPLAFVLGPDETLEESPGTVARSFLEETQRYWQEWVRTLAVPFDWQDEVIRAAITLKLCTFEDSGAVLAALTTSIPESPWSGRNWDYRFCWLRDAYFVVQALNRLGATRTMEGYLHYIDQIVARTGDAPLRPLYPIAGEAATTERTLASLEGFLGMGPVRVGNQAEQQVQHDVYGAVILAASQLFFDQRLARPGTRELFHQLEGLGRRAAALFEAPDAGPWEFRGTLRAHTFSAAMSWAGCDRLSRIATRLDLPVSAASWRQTADSMRERILAQSWNSSRGAFMGDLAGSALDASVLLLAELGLLPAQDPRFTSTVDVIGRELRAGDLVFRYRHEDDFGQPESAFTVCAFWYVNALAATGRMEEAREQFTSLLAKRNPVGLLSEDIDPKTGELWGNFPQTYSMVGIINGAIRLSRSWEAAL
jgi:GH15 family glucan-1,4-alpha-glucosidase